MFACKLKCLFIDSLITDFKLSVKVSLLAIIINKYNKQNQNKIYNTSFHHISDINFVLLIIAVIALPLTVRFEEHHCFAVI